MKTKIESIAVCVILLMAVFLVASKWSIFGFRTFVVESGSMQPALLTGSVIIVKPTKNYTVSNIISFRQSGRPAVIVTHRLVETQSTATQQLFVTKGDANQKVDAEKVSPKNVLGKVIFTIPFIGYLFQFARTLPGLILLVFTPAILIIVGEILTIKNELTRKLRHALILLLFLPVFLTTTTTVRAYFSDPVISLANTLSASSLDFRLDSVNSPPNQTLNPGDVLTYHLTVVPQTDIPFDYDLAFHDTSSLRGSCDQISFTAVSNQPSTHDWLLTFLLPNDADISHTLECNFNVDFSGWLIGSASHAGLTDVESVSGRLLLQPRPELSVTISPDSHYLDFQVNHLAQFTHLSYTLTYHTGLKTTGVEGSTDIDPLNPTISRHLLLGTCSELSCVYDSSPADFLLQINLTGTSSPQTLNWTSP